MWIHRSQVKFSIGKRSSSQADLRGLIRTAQTDFPQEEQEPDEQDQTEGEVGDETKEKGAPESEGYDEEGTRPEGETGRKERSDGGIPNPPGNEATTDSVPPKGDRFKVDPDLPRRGRRDRGKRTQPTFTQKFG